MKKVSVNLYAFYGMGCSGCSYGSDQSSQFEVSDEVAALLSQMLAKKGEALNQDDITAAIEAGHSGLKKLYAAIEKEHRHMVVDYWLFEADNDCIYESLEPYFWQDIEDGTYEPEKSIEELIQEYRDEHPDEEDDWDWDNEEEQKGIYYNELSGEYLNWVNGHRDDYWFIAERVGIDLSVVYEDMPELEFNIEGIEDFNP